MEQSSPSGNLTGAAAVAHFTLIDYSVFSALLAISFAIGLYFGIFSKGNQSTEEYLHGGRKMRPLPIAFSLIARYVHVSNLGFQPLTIYYTISDKNENETQARFHRTQSWQKQLKSIHLDGSTFY